MTYTSLMETNDLHILDVIQKLVARSKGTDYFLYASCNFTAHQSSSPREVTEWQQLRKSTCNILQRTANNDDAWLAFIVCEDINCNIWNRLLSAKTDAYVRVGRTQRRHRIYRAVLPEHLPASVPIGPPARWCQHRLMHILSRYHRAVFDTGNHWGPVGAPGWWKWLDLQLQPVARNLSIIHTSGHVRCMYSPRHTAL